MSQSYDLIYLLNKLKVKHSFNNEFWNKKRTDFLKNELNKKTKKKKLINEIIKDLKSI